MKKFSIEASIKHAWTLFKNNQQFLILSSLAFLLLGAISDKGNNYEGYGHVYREGFEYGHMMMHSHGASFGMLGLVAFIFALIMKVGYLKALLKIERGGHASLKELFDHVNLIWKYILASIAYGLSIVVGFVLLVIPGVYVMLKYLFVPILIIDKDLGVKQAFKKSAHMTEGNKWHLLGFILILALLNLLGAIPFGIGLIFTIPVTYLAYVHIYELLHHEA